MMESSDRLNKELKNQDYEWKWWKCIESKK